MTRQSPCAPGLLGEEEHSSAHAMRNTYKPSSQHESLHLTAQRQGSLVIQKVQPGKASPEALAVWGYRCSTCTVVAFLGAMTLVFPGIQTQVQSDPGTPSYFPAPGSSPHRPSELLTSLLSVPKNPNCLHTGAREGHRPLERKDSVVS